MIIFLIITRILLKLQLFSLSEYVNRLQIAGLSREGCVCAYFQNSTHAFFTRCSLVQLKDPNYFLGAKLSAKASGPSFL